MKFVKFGIFALSLGLFVASCGNNEEPATEETIITEEVITPEPAPVEAAPVDTDSTVAPAETTETVPAP